MTEGAKQSPIEANNFCCPDKDVQFSSSDRITSLPCDAINHILLCLPLQEAARTSILSKTWRHRWIHISHLVFDDMFTGLSQEAMQHSTNLELVMKRVSEALFHHTGPLREDLKSRRGKISNLIENFCCLPTLEFLDVDDYFLKNFVVPDASVRLQTTLNHLKVLNMCSLELGEMEVVLGALCLLRSSPNLKKLVILVCDNQKPGMNAFLQLLESNSHMDFSLNQLEKVELLVFTWTRAEVELVKLLLAKSSALKLMRIKYNYEMDAQILMDLNGFKRASVEAEIICEDMRYVCCPRTGLVHETVLGY